MENNVFVRICYVEIPDSGEESGFHIPKETIEFNTLFGGGHHVDWYSILMWTIRSIKDLSVFAAFLLKDVLWSDKDVRCEFSYPPRKWHDKIILLLLVHGFHDLGEFLLDRWMVTSIIVCEEVGPGSFSDKLSGTAYSHYLLKAG